MTLRDDVRGLVDGLSLEDISDLVDGMSPAMTEALLAELGQGYDREMPGTPAEQAVELDSGYLIRDHIRLLADRLAQAIEDVRGGQSRFLVVSMPPRSGKSLLVSVYLVLWVLRIDPTWKVGLVSHNPHLATSWGRTIRNLVDKWSGLLGLAVAADAGAASEWQTTQGGSVLSRSAPGQSLTGYGFNILLVDDVVKDFAAAHSETNRQTIWEWWQANAVTRLEPPALVVVVGTRWHEDDFIGRLLSTEYDGDPDDWEQITLPALAEEDDALGREVGEPLLSPIVKDETKDQALVRWAGIKKSVGEYAWAALFQQRPAPAQGAIFNLSRFRYWTLDPARVDPEDPNLILLDPTGGVWLDSWDMAFKATDTSDYVVGQRWVRVGANRFLVDQRRSRWTFTQTLGQVLDFGKTGPFSDRVHLRLVEDKANGTAILDTLHDKVPGLKAINPTTSKEARARAVTPEVESGNVYLPNPAEYPWVQALLAEVRGFPTAVHDDQVDAMTQALMELRTASPAAGTMGRPATRTPPPRSPRTAAARTGVRRSLGG